MTAGRPAILVLTPGGLAAARRIAHLIDADIHARAGMGEADETFAETAGHLRALFRQNRPIIGLCAAGILIRALAPLLADKRAEPPVLALSEDGASIVPLLGGHHGGNALARRIAEALGGHAAVTTAGDSRFGVALDAPPPGWSLANPHDAKAVMARCLAGGTLRLEGDAPWLAQSALPFDAAGGDRLVATVNAEAGDEKSLIYHPRKLALGLGCERGADVDEVIALVETALAGADLAKDAIACVVSIDVKADEAAILAAAEWLGVPARFFSAERLEAETPRL
ncbi:MAG: cobalamin biosynthesis protein, partial [Hyphomicrobiales bacterium]|nr:cobalamin biosynthesis protein [Hyphomicrobiales bacterium]